MNSFALAQETLLVPQGITTANVEEALDALCAHKIDYGDLYFQQSEYESWSLEDSKVKSGSFSLDRGVGVRAIAGAQTGFAYADEISLPSVLRATEVAREIGEVGHVNALPLKDPTKMSKLYSKANPLAALNAEEKIAILQHLDSEIRKEDKAITQVFANLVGVHEQVLVAATDGTLASDIRPLIRLNITVVIEKDGKREQGSAGMGGRYALSMFSEEETMTLAREALRQAWVSMEAKAAPAGTMDVVLGSGWPGVLLHEAVGHGLEADFNRKQTSVFSNKIGEQVANPLCTIVDDGSLPNRRGSLQIDDEGVPTQRTVLIEDGILKGYMQDKLNARLMGEETTGNGRRESYAHLPMPRMTNTFMLAGESSQAEMIAKVKDGILAVNFAGGQVDITSGKFVFTTSEAYRIENGKVTHPVKGATLVGNGPDVMQKVTMVGDDLALDKGVGICGKEGQSVPVGVGQPSLLVEGLTVGGTSHG